MTILSNKLLHQSGKKPIVYDVDFEASKTAKPIVIFCHGYKGFKDWGAQHLVAESFAESGFFFIKFNFSHNGGTGLRHEEFVTLPWNDIYEVNAYEKLNYSDSLDLLLSDHNISSILYGIGISDIKKEIVTCKLNIGKIDFLMSTKRKK